MVAIISKDDPGVWVQDKIWLPTWVAENLWEKRRQEVIQMAKQKRLEADPGYQYERERSRKDAKPLVFRDGRTDTHRPVIIVGGGGMWYEDMKDMARRAREKPNPKDDPYRVRRDPKVDVAESLDRRYRQSRGTRTFHIPNNPLVKEFN